MHNKTLINTGNCGEYYVAAQINKAIFEYETGNLKLEQVQELIEQSWKAKHITDEQMTYFCDQLIKY